ncbi:MAG: macro domain-containing protein [Lachnospiraceae bacterium]|jgi:O-acetyl-ADP-ribose deacetylase (regulator of RNase III)
MECTVIRDDITHIRADALILPANAGLVIESGVSKAVFDAAGRKFLTESCHKALKDARDQKKAGVRGLPEGSAVRTLAGDLPATYIIHSVVPSWKDGNSGEEDRLREALAAALREADLIGASSVALPLLGAGSRRFDSVTSFTVLRDAILSYQPFGHLSSAVICLYDSETVQRLKSAGIPFEERIDEAYVLAHDETLPAPAIEIMETAAQRAGKAGQAVKKQAGSAASEVSRRAQFMHNQARQAAFDFQQHAAQAGRDMKFIAGEASQGFRRAMQDPQTREYTKQAVQIIGEVALSIVADKALRKVFGAASNIIKKKK